MKLFRVSLLGKYGSCIVRAKDEQHARQIAIEYKYIHESASLWLNPEYSFCSEINVDGEPGLILKT